MMRSRPFSGRAKKEESDFAYEKTTTTRIEGDYSSIHCLLLPLVSSVRTKPVKYVLDTVYMSAQSVNTYRRYPVLH